MVVTTVGLIVLAASNTLHRDILWAIGGGGLAVALVGLADDRRSLSASTRLAVHFAAALWALAWLGGLPALRIGSDVVLFGAAGYLLGACGIVWVVNLFNFMDGIDGIAASEAIFVAIGGALLSVPIAGGNGVFSEALVFAGACGGFLLWNWPPAGIFLGDVGSGYLGYVIAVLAVAVTRDNPAALWVWLILGGAFFVDATVTVLRRILRRERFYEAHRSHAYQWLAGRWGSHHKVTLTVLVVNVVWLLPCGVLAATFPRYAAVLVAASLSPLALVALAVGAGRRQTSAQSEESPNGDAR